LEQVSALFFFFFERKIVLLGKQTIIIKQGFLSAYNAKYMGNMYTSFSRTTYVPFLTIASFFIHLHAQSITVTPEPNPYNEESGFSLLGGNNICIKFNTHQQFNIDKLGLAGERYRSKLQLI